MPELIEVEQYRVALESLVGCELRVVEVSHAEYVRPRGAPVESLTVGVGGTLIAARRRGKLLLADIDCAGTRRGEAGTATIGLRFGMTGILLIDGQGPIEKLEYASTKKDPRWDRVRLHIGRSVVSVRDQRRLGSIELDPDETVLGPDASTVTFDELSKALHGRRAVKAVLLDQRRLAGVGNLLADEALWRTALDPARPADELGQPEVERLADAIRETVRVLSERGGSHTGDTFAHRVAGALCPRCGGPMAHTTVGGRSTWWCSQHQR